MTNNTIAFDKNELIDFNLLHKTLEYYKCLDYTRIEVPWLVSDKASLITIPKDKIYNIKKIENDGRCFIGSAEQGFLQLYLDELIEKNISYVSISPCIRYDEYDDTHREQFYKIELSSVVDTEFEAKIKSKEFFTHAKELFSMLLKTKKVTIQMKNNKMDDLTFNNLELGSYGYRELEDGSYLVFGTGLALPRLTMTQTDDKLGYHQSYIVKGQLNQISKISEELDELVDAYNQNNKILQICELSDLIGAIEDYSKSLNVSLQDLIEFSHLTKKAFIDKIR